MKSGLLLDIDDDPQGETLREIFHGELPHYIKTARALSAYDRERLPDDVFALVIADDGQVLRKFACVDAGNTAVSSMYFLKYASKLPREVQEATAQNLVTAAGWYDLPVPEPLEKLALGLLTRPQSVGPLLAAMTAIPIAKGTAQQVRSNLAATRALERSGHGVVTPEMREQALKVGHALGSGSHALGDRYPLESYADVQRASLYFDDFEEQFSPDARRTYATALVKRANQLGVAVSDTARKYGSTSYAPTAELLASRDIRKNALAGDALACAELDELYEKRAELQPTDFCAALGAFDTRSGLVFEYDRFVPDPFFSTFGVEKQASSDFSEVIGNDLVTGNDLRRLARTGQNSLRDTFHSDFLEEFQKDPIGIFKSLPREQKVLLMRMATDRAPGDA